MNVLVLEPDYWRYLGILQILESDDSINLLGERDHTRVLAMTNRQKHLAPHVLIVSHSLTIDYKLDIIQHLRRLFPAAHILVAGYEQALESIARILAAGAKGYFLLSSEPSKLLLALNVVREGHIWAPRDAVALMSAQKNEHDGDGRSHRAADLISAVDLSIMKLLQKGLGNKQMASSLDVAEVTVKSHLTKLYKRFGVRTRLELLAYAITHRLIASDQVSRPRRQRSA